MFCVVDELRIRLSKQQELANLVPIVFLIKIYKIITAIVHAWKLVIIRVIYYDSISAQRIFFMTNSILHIVNGSKSQISYLKN